MTVSRFLHRIWPAGNPLARGWDKTEAALLVVAVLVVLMAIPVALTAGSRTYGDFAAQAEQQRENRLPATARLLAAAPDAVGTTGVLYQVDAVWRLPDGSERRGAVGADAGTPAGDTVHIWLDRSGNPVPPPLAAGDVIWIAIGVGLFLWLGVVLACGLLLVAAHFLFDSRRAAAWARDWAKLSREVEKF